LHGQVDHAGCEQNGCCGESQLVDPRRSIRDEIALIVAAVGNRQASNREARTGANPYGRGRRVYP
jgi:hypothetical protein